MTQHADQLREIRRSGRVVFARSVAVAFLIAGVIFGVVFGLYAAMGWSFTG